MKLLIIPNIGKGNTLSALSRLRECLHRDNCELLFQENYRDYIGELGDRFSTDIKGLLDECDAVITLGGDGTIIHAAKLAAQASKPTLGINLGHLGFNAGLEDSELEQVSKLISGDYTTEKRMMLTACVVGENGRTRAQCHVINDAVISRGSLAAIIDVSVYHNDRLAMDFRADGIIVGTPTGSTAYSMSAGGPVIDPNIRCIELTPICPHSLHTRPIMFAPDSVLRIEASQRIERAVFGSGAEGGAFLSIDGETVYPLQKGDSVMIERSDLEAEFIVIKRQSFAEVLREKFM